MVIHAKDYGVTPGKDVTKELEALTASLKGDEEKTLVFEKGDYFIESSKLQSRMLYITNTAGDKEYEKSETPHKSRCPLYFEGVKNTKIDFGGAKFILNGGATNISLVNCENVTLENGAVTAVKPDLHRLDVISKTAFSVDFKIDENSDYYVKDKALYFKGVDYEYNAVKKYRNAWHPAHIKAGNEGTVKRTSGFFKGALGVKEVKKGVIRINYLNTSLFSKGDVFYLFENRRQYVGIFIDNSKNITLHKMTENFNYSLAVVAQCCENLTITECDFSPEKGSGCHIASLADFIQICMCSGNVLVENNNFEGACDDCLNAHGIHFRIKKKTGNKLIVAFSHPQTHGFNPLFKGDKIVYTKPLSLMEQGSAEIVSSRLINEHNIELEVTDASSAQVGYVVEDLTRIPNVTFRYNRVNRIITRAILLTMRGKAVVENNHFMSNSMSGILLSDDALSWYESGPCRDVLIKDNIFDYCGGVPILISPENLVHEGYIHKNVRITGNKFNNYKGIVMKIKSSEDIEISGNTFAKSRKIKTINSRNVNVK